MTPLSGPAMAVGSELSPTPKEETKYPCRSSK